MKKVIIPSICITALLTMSFIKNDSIKNVNNRTMIQKANLNTCKNSIQGTKDNLVVTGTDQCDLAIICMFRFPNSLNKPSKLDVILDKY